MAATGDRAKRQQNRQTVKVAGEISELQNRLKVANTPKDKAALKLKIKSKFDRLKEVEKVEMDLIKLQSRGLTPRKLKDKNGTYE